MRSITYPPNPIHSLDISEYETLSFNWKYSVDKLGHYNKIFNDRLTHKDVSIIVAGSYGRLEASENSDVDFVVLTRKELIESERKTLLSEIRSVLDDLKVEFPNPEGVFSSIISLENCANNIGHDTDSLKPLAQRILLILESKAVYNDDLFQEVVSIILEKYCEFVIKEPDKQALFLMNDVIRYFRSICVNYQYNFWRQTEKWTLRNVKLRHSRIIMYAGTLLPIMNASKHDDKHKYIRELIDLTPLERISLVYKENNNDGYREILEAYNMFLSKINDPEIRNNLKLDYDSRYQSPHYKDLKKSSDAIRKELTRFILEGNTWPAEVLEYLIF